MRFAASPLPIPAARVQKEASGFSEISQALFGNPNRGAHEKVHRSSGYRHLAHNADGHRYSPRWHANQTRFYFSAPPSVPTHGRFAVASD